MEKFREQSLRFGTEIITETVSKVDLSQRPFRYWREGQEDEEAETADTLIIATGASAKRLNLKGEDTYWQSGISACAVCDGAVPIFRCASRHPGPITRLICPQEQAARGHRRRRLRRGGGDLPHQVRLAHLRPRPAR